MEFSRITKQIKRITVGVCVLSMLFSKGVAAEDKGSKDLDQMICQTAQSIKNTPEKSGEYLLKYETIMFPCSPISDWTAMSLAFAGETEAYDSYLTALEDYVKEQYDRNGALDEIKATEYHRIALTMLALGGDPSKVEVSGETVNLIADGTYDFQGEALDLQGSNACIYALITLDAKDYEVPEDVRYTRADIIRELLDYQCEEGGFGLAGNSDANIDITAMALQALAPYTGDGEVKAAVDRALCWLSEQMSEQGTFQYYGEESEESIAQVILALCALGQDPETDSQFQKNGNNLLEGLESFRLPDGRYCHMLSDAQADRMSDYQALLALEAVQKLRQDGTRLFDLSDYQAPVYESGENGSHSSVVIFITVIVIVLVTVMIRIGSRMKARQK